MSSSLAVNHMLDMRQDNLSAKVSLTKYEGTKMARSSNIGVNPRIGIGQVHMLGDEGMDKPQAPQLPPELLQKIRDTLARGIAKSIVAKSINQISQETLEAKAKI
ncbi:MAG: hypothetical protein FWE91_05615 [Defluviitaleaceae bacterium]|nr:hypothetical protein [Defluviitaleaceae bacterium]